MWYFREVLAVRECCEIKYQSSWHSHNAPNKMTVRPQTIQIFLPNGVPHGIRVADITTRIVQAIEVPRKLLGEFFTMPECKQVALYFLFGKSDDGAEDWVYVWQTCDLTARLEKHHKDKDFWQRALVIISRTHSLTQTHALYLEWLCIQEAKKAKRYGTENGTNGTKPHTPAPLEADCQEIFDTTRTLLATLGYPIFEPVLSKDANSANKRYYCTRSGANAVGEYTEEGFVVLKDSKGRASMSTSFVDHTFGRRRAELLQHGKLAMQEDALVFLEDILFSSPSGAAAVVVGNTSNGWRDWKDAQGRTLEEMERDKPEGFVTPAVEQ